MRATRRDFVGWLGAGVAAATARPLAAWADRLRILGEILVNLVSDDVNIRIAKLILRLSARYGTRVGKDIFLNIPLTHQEIADACHMPLGTVKVTLFRACQQLKVCLSGQALEPGHE